MSTFIGTGNTIHYIINLLPSPNTFKIGSNADLVPGMYYLKIYNPDVTLHETLYVNEYTSY
jgi:hypothetical protein